MESKLDILRKPTQEGKLQHMLGRGRKRLHKTQEKLDEQTQEEYLVVFPPEVSLAVCLFSWILTQLLKL